MFDGDWIEYTPLGIVVGNMQENDEIVSVFGKLQFCVWKVFVLSLETNNKTIGSFPAFWKLSQFTVIIDVPSELVIERIFTGINNDVVFPFSVMESVTVVLISVELSVVKLVWLFVELFTLVEGISVCTVSISSGIVTGTGIGVISSPLSIPGIDTQTPVSGLVLFPIKSIVPIYISKVWLVDL